MKENEKDAKNSGSKAQLPPFDPPNPDSVKKTQHMKENEKESKKEAKKSSFAAPKANATAAVQKIEAPKANATAAA